MFAKYLTLLLIVIAIGTGTACSTNSETVMAAASPVETAITAAQSRIDKMPDSPAGYRDLAMIYIKLGRETGDLAFNEKAELAIERGLISVPADTELRKLKAVLFLSGHEFAQAKEIGEKLEKELPNDQFVLGILTDANLELGNYAASIEYAQKMVNAKPNSSSYARVANVRSVHGDYPGAVKMYELSAKTADPADKEAQSWALVQLGNLHLRNGQFEAADSSYDEALSNFPHYHLALTGKGKARAMQGDLAGAIPYLTEAIAKTPYLDTVVFLGDVYTKMGDAANAKLQYEYAQSEEKLGAHFDAHRLALFSADNDIDLAESLDVAQADYANQKDIYASDTLAWCLYKNGKYVEAQAMMKEAMRVGTKDAKLWYHAGMIELKLGNKANAKQLISDALKLNPSFDLIQSEIARNTLKSLG
jgi:tetratricopeptide (TPR) repeat protein